MNDVITGTAVSVQTGVYTADCLEIAKSILEGETSDYYFFQYAANEYVLLVGDIEFSGVGCVASECAVYDFLCSPVQSVQTVQIPFSGSQSGQYGGSDGAGGFSGSVTGNSTIQIQSDIRYNVTYAYQASAQNISVTNSGGYLVYGSAQQLPHLIEGVQNYAFAAFALAWAVICFKLLDRLFRRVY